MTPKEIRDLSAAQLAQTRAKYYPLRLATWALVGISLALLIYGLLTG